MAGSLRAFPGFVLALSSSLVIWAAWGGALVTTSPPARERARHRIVRAWGRWMLFAFGVRLALEGEPPRGPGLLVVNHSSYLDILALSAATGARFVSMAELARWPLVGPMARSVGTLLIDRSRKRELLPVGRALAEAFERGELVVLFPEGRSTRGARVHTFRSALLEPAARAGVPVYVAALHYSTDPPDPPAGLLVPWTDGVPYLPHALRLFAARRVRARLRFGSSPLRGTERRALARASQAAVEALFEPLEGACDPPG